MIRVTLVVSAILASASMVLACVYTPSQCQCSVSTSPGTCMRYQSGPLNAATCEVDNCKTGNYKCDCSGTSLCSLSACGAWTATGLTGTEVIGDTVNCAFDAAGSATDRKCTKFTGALPSAGASPSSTPSSAPAAGATPTSSPSATPTSSPAVAYEVRIGGAVAGAELFDLAKYTDAASLTYIYSPTDPQNIVWPDSGDVKRRFINFRIYDDVNTPQKFLCVIYNKAGGAPDGQGVMTAKVTVIGVAGQAISTILCDDPGECTVAGGSVLLYNHFISTFNNDGFCVGDLRDGQVRLQFSELNALDGISFQSPAGVVKEWLFDAATLPNGMVTNGLDSNGNSNEATLDMYIDLVNLMTPI